MTRRALFAVVVAVLLAIPPAAAHALTGEVSARTEQLQLQILELQKVNPGLITEEQAAAMLEWVEQAFTRRAETNCPECEGGNWMPRKMMTVHTRTPGECPGQQNGDYT